MFRRRQAISEAVAEEAEQTGPAVNPEIKAILGRVTLTGDPEMDSLTIREEFHIRLIELADQFDHLDHEISPSGSSELQDDCQAVRELTRKKMHPRFHEVFFERQTDMLDAQILSGLVAGPDAK